ncbi:hypothetical protein E4U53_005563 [Claviceps sorghi]|nr:hypothetical protein E4U53_005563 [Claviceps sorghi]
MAQNPPVQRTAPIAIAPKPSRRAPTPQRQESVSRFEIGPSSVQTVASIETTSLAASTNPCESCRSSATKCVLDDDEDSLALIVPFYRVYWQVLILENENWTDCHITKPAQVSEGMARKSWGEITPLAMPKDASVRGNS